MKLYFIGGASGSGKTAIMPELQKILGSEKRWTLKIGQCVKV